MAEEDIPVEPKDDNLFLGCLFGCMIQVAGIVLGFIVASQVHNPKIANWLGLSFGLTQWLGIVPLVLRQRAKGHRSVVQGLLITGFIGLLLSSACATILNGFQPG